MKIQQKKMRGGGQGRCEQKSEVFVKIQNNFFFFFFFFWGGGVRLGGQVWGGGGQGRCKHKSEVF